jgi:VWFA-related protein
MHAMGCLGPRTLLAAVCACASLAAQVPQQDPLIFKTKVNVITVPVVVRDKNGKVVDGLRQEDFQLFDKGKLQTISNFSIERAEGNAAPGLPAAGRTTDVGNSAAPTPRFVAFFFDDINLAFENISITRTAFQKYLAAKVRPGDRAGIFTTSGLTNLDFTDDRAQLDAAVRKIVPHPMAALAGCPGMSALEAIRILDLGDSQLLQKKAAQAVAAHCARDIPTGMGVAQGAAQNVKAAVDIRVRDLLDTMANAIRGMAQLPGQRVLVLASPGFIKSVDHSEGGVIDLAIRSNVVINALDGRGLVTSLSSRGPEAEAAMAGILAELSEDTGGKFIHNTNDFEGGFEQLASAPEATYMLGFSPLALNFDGSYHALKVTLQAPGGMSVQARRGYYAVESHPAETAKSTPLAQPVQTESLSMADSTDIAISGTAELVSGASQPAVKLKLSLNPSGLSLRPEEQGSRLKISRTVVELNAKGVALVEAKDAKDILVPTQSMEAIYREGIHWEQTLPVVPDAFAVRVTVRDETSGHVGSLTLPMSDVK